MNSEQRARELLAEEYRRDGNDNWAHALLKNGPEQGAEAASVRAIARALEQPASAAGVEGMVMVPREPTRDMILEGLKAGDWRKQGRVQNIWNAMLAAAPKPENS